jgi:hypothetical protein
MKCIQLLSVAVVLLSQAVSAKIGLRGHNVAIIESEDSQVRTVQYMHCVFFTGLDQTTSDLVVAPIL